MQNVGLTGINLSQLTEMLPRQPGKVHQQCMVHRYCHHKCCVRQNNNIESRYYTGIIVVTTTTRSTPRVLWFAIVKWILWELHFECGMFV